MASSWGLGKRSRGRYRLLGWAVAGLLLPATGLAQVPAGPLDNMVATLFFAGLGVTIR